MSSTICLVYDNLADAGTLSGGTWTVPLSNLQDPRPSIKARSADATTTATQFVIDLGAAGTFLVLALTHTNLTSAAQYKITWSSDNFSTTDGTAGWLSIPGYPSDDPDNIGAAIFHIFATATSARYWKFELDDTANPDGYVEAGRLFMGTTWQPAYNFDEGGNSDAVTANTSRQNSLGGSGYFNRRKPVRTFSFGFGALPPAEAPTIRRIRKICNLDLQVVIIPDPTDTANLNDIAFLGTLKDMPALQRLQVDYWAAAGFTVTESV